MPEAVMFLAATAVEAAPLGTAMAGRSESPIAIVGVGASGVERLRAALQRHRPARVVAFGLAGSLAVSIPVGATIVTRRWLDEHGAPRAESHASAREWAGRSLGRAAIAFTEIDVVTVPAPMHGARERDALRSRTGAAAVEMEGAHWAAIAADAGIELASVRVISDDCNLALPLPRHLLLCDDGSVRWARWASALSRGGAITRLPGEWQRMRRAQREWTVATRSLSRAAAALVASVTSSHQ